MSHIAKPSRIQSLAIFASFQDAKAFAGQSLKIHLQQQHALVGCTLHLLSHWKLQQDCIQTSYAIAYLQQQKPEALSRLLHFLYGLSPYLAGRIPKISLEAAPSIDTYIWACRQALELPQRPAATKQPKPIKQRSNLLIHSIESETRKQARILLANIQELISPQLRSILRSSLSGNLLATMNDALRDNLIKALRKYENEDCDKMAHILKTTKDQATVQEKITKGLLDTFELASDSFASASQRPRLSIKEKLALKAAGRNIQQTAEGDNTAHAPCDNLNNLNNLNNQQQDSNQQIVEDSIEAEYHNASTISSQSEKAARFSQLLHTLEAEVEAENSAEAAWGAAELEAEYAELIPEAQLSDFPEFPEDAEEETIDFSIDSIED